MYPIAFARMQDTFCDGKRVFGYIRADDIAEASIR